MIRPRDFSRDVFAVCLLELCTAFEQAGLSREEIGAALRARLRVYGGPTPPQSSETGRPADGAEVYVDVREDGHVF